MKYYSRYVERQIDKALKSSGCIVIAGPKFSGKTTTAMQFQRSYIKLNTEDSIKLAELNPKSMLLGDKPRLIDEWQMVPEIWNQIKNDLDDEYEFGKYILTGSSTPADKEKIYHSGAGRIVRIKMRPMSLYESKESDGKVQLSDLLDGNDVSIDENKDFSLDDVAKLVVRGGWPISVLADPDISLDVTYNYFLGLFSYENSLNGKFRNKKPEVLRMIIKSYARAIASETSIETILKDVRQSNERTMDRKSFDEYLEALKDLYIIEDLDAWNPNFRSAVAVRATPTRHFADPSIAAAALNISPKDLINDLETFGLFFEDLAIRDLRVYAESIEGEVRHYRDNTGLECDSVLHFRDGRWGLCEIKLGGSKLIEEGAHNLLTLKRKLEKKSNEKSPSFMMILVATGPLYRRADGIYVVPINKLKA